MEPSRIVRDGGRKHDSQIQQSGIPIPAFLLFPPAAAAAPAAPPSAAGAGADTDGAIASDLRFLSAVVL
jgi:hypothetical protein